MFGIFLQLLPAALTLGRQIWRSRRHAASELPSLDLARYAPGTGPITPLPPGWERWNGARPEPRGAPNNTILLVRGLDKMTPVFRAKLLDLCEELEIPVDSLAAIISNESIGFDPKALNPLPAAGLIQLTTGANLDGFTTKDAIRSIIKMSAEEQIDRVIRPYYQRMKAAQGAHPGRIYMLNFLPNDANNPEDFKLGIEDKEAAATNAKPRDWRGKVYAVNKGFDRQKKGYFTIGDVYAVSASICRGAKGRRITVDGRVLEAAPAAEAVARATGPATAPPPPAAPPPAPATPAPAVAAPAPAPASGQAAGPASDPQRWVCAPELPALGLLERALAEGRILPPVWVAIDAGNLIIEVTTDALRAPLTIRTGSEERLHPAVRLPVSYREQERIARALGAISPTAEWWDAAWKAAAIKVQPKPLPPDRLMASVGRAVAHSSNIDAYSPGEGVLIRDVGKGWILHPRLAERGAVNYGWIQPQNAKQIQSVGGRHDAAHYDYSQTCVLVRRIARDRAGNTVDLLDYLEGQGINRRWLDVYR